MKKRIKLLLCAVFVTPLFTASVALAVEEQAAETNTETQTTQSEMSTEQKQKLDQRVKERKDAAKLRLTNAEQTRIKNRCTNAQGVLKNVEGKIKGVETSREKVYGNLVDRLNKLEAKLSTKGVDTTELKSEITALQAKVTTFNTDLATYKQAVADLSAMDCQADPTAFKASLEAARAARLQVRTDSLAIRTYVNETIKPTLKAIRDSLSSDTSSETPSGTESNQ